jgi:hypothetical protein
LTLAVVRDLREQRRRATLEELADFETDVLAGFVLARSSAGLVDRTIQGDVRQLDQVRAWFGRPLWEMEPSDADAYFGKILQPASKATRLARAQAMTTYFQFLELRHKVEIHQMTGRVVECPIDELNRPRGSKQPSLRIPPTEAEMAQLFAGWRGELASCRKVWLVHPGLQIVRHQPCQHPAEERERLHMASGPGLVHPDRRRHEQQPRARQHHHKRPDRVPAPGLRIGPHTEPTVVGLRFR